MLRGLRVAVIHAPDQDGEALIRQLRRIGCQVQAVWPAPIEPPPGIDLVFMNLDHRFQPAKSWAMSEDAPAVVAILEYENPVILKALIVTGVHGVLVKPLRPAGILSTLVLARWLHGYHRRLDSKVRKLEETIKAQRDISKAARILAEVKGVSESDAFETIRNQATRRRISMSEVAASIIGAQDVLKDLSRDE
ncbi:ANTAR domain-containing response regulator [Paracoccus nototheniae]|uniref:ANTAR domain-containing response regulator n=1 Tax=Paracoccus nototheniae TaxID=2489002 RepID=A0ABW4E0G7_9RHOB|nr:ANTAR domain-containing protein [Paracoccus nototheniae]